MWDAELPRVQEKCDGLRSFDAGKLVKQILITNRSIIAQSDGSAGESFLSEPDNKPKDTPELRRSYSGKKLSAGFLLQWPEQSLNFNPAELFTIKR